MKSSWRLVTTRVLLRAAVLPVYLALVRPHLEHRAQFGAPQYKRKVEVLDRAHWWATVLVRAGAQGVRGEATKAGFVQPGEGKAEGRDPLLLSAGRV